jgi:hypothetical protein
MDTMRGSLGSLAESADYDHAEDEAGHDTPPAAIGQDERRLQVRAYNLWAGLLGNRNYPAVEDLEPGNLPDFGAYSVLLDFTGGIDNPGVAYLGDKLAEECGVAGEALQTLADVPARSLLTRITDHYMQILANQTPIGFEAEFVNQRGAAILYRGILLPFSSDDDTIDFIYGVINWKELADAHAADELLLEIEQALEPRPATAPNREEGVPLTDWADGPGSLRANASDKPAESDPSPAPNGAEGLPIPSFGGDDALGDSNREHGEQDEDPFDLAALDESFLPLAEMDDEESAGLLEEDDESDEEGDGPSYGSLLRMPLELSRTADKPPVSLSGYGAAEGETAEFASEDLPEIDPDEMGLGDWLASARELALAASSNEDRTRGALYQAIGRAYDFSLAAAGAPQEFEELLADAELTAQGRAPMTPVVKLVFGADYDKTRLTEYAAALSHAHRLQLPLGSMGEFLGRYEGGLKGVVNAERRLRKEEAGKPVDHREGPRPALARKLREMPERGFESIAAEGSEFALVMIRRTEAGEIVLLGEVPNDVALVERAARRLIA